MAKAKKVTETANLPAKMSKDYLPATVRAQLEARASKDKARTRASTGDGVFMSLTRDGQFVVDSEEIGDSIDVVLLAFCHLNEYYDKPFGKVKNDVPACYALSDEPEGMTPAANVTDKQSDACDTCPMAEFGSAMIGEGRACKQKMRLVFLSADQLKPEEIARAPLATLRTPPLAKLEFEKFVNVVLGEDRPKETVITRITTDKNRRYNDSLTLRFEAVQQLPGKVVEAILARVEEAESFVKRSITPKAQGKARRGGAGRAAGKGRAAKAVAQTRATRKSRFAAK